MTLRISTLLKVNKMCRECEVGWTSLRACHCAECHTQFVGVIAFDAHMHSDGCVVPTDGLQRVLGRRNYAFYSTPQGFTTRKIKEASSGR